MQFVKCIGECGKILTSMLICDQETNYLLYIIIIIIIIIIIHLLT
jgi:hypothetical protein